MRYSGQVLLMDVTNSHIGCRLCEVRSWRPVTKRAVLESLGNALQVPPAEMRSARLSG